jgi:hypothetical protein
MTGPNQDAADRAAAAPAAAPAPRGPRRRCIASGRVDDKSRLLRFVAAPDGTIHADPGEELPGRGLWLRPDPDMIDKARRKRLFARAARAEVTVPEDLADRVACLLRQRCLARIGLARVAGDAVAGFEKVRTLLKRDAAGVLLQARDGAADGRAKVRRLAAAVRPDLPVVDWFDAGELGRAVGREQCMHLALRRGGHADRLLREARRYAAFAGQPDGPATAVGAAPPGETDGDRDNQDTHGTDAPGAGPTDDEFTNRAPERNDDEQ